MVVIIRLLDPFHFRRLSIRLIKPLFNLKAFSLWFNSVITISFNWKHAFKMIQPRSRLAWTQYESKSKKYSAWDTSRIYFLVLKFSGFIAYSIDGKIENGRIKIKIVDLLIMMLALCIYSFTFYINTQYDLTLIQTKSPTIDVGNRLIHNFIILNVFATVFLNFIMKYSIWGILRSFSKFDIDVSGQSLCI